LWGGAGYGLLKYVEMPVVATMAADKTVLKPET
jgi:hypothetical protein